MARRNEAAGNRGKSDSRNRKVTEIRIPRKRERTGEAISGRHNEIAGTIENQAKSRLSVEIALFISSIIKEAE